ncbi:carboxypeptidase regulatory-like domain-containing protein [Flavobacterium sp. LaA7.5]|nr:carboxypeptidase regulatory-like domain-containing protein [Flavobacterium salilacus subsp. altitudinum]
MKKIIILLVFLSFACSGDDDANNDVICTEEARAGLNVTVKNAETGQVIGEGITVVATDGNYTETLEYYLSSPQFTGAWEREGTYVITVSGEGYQTYISDPVTVEADECHVIGEIVTINLQPE